MDEDGLDLDPMVLMKAFELVGPYATGKSNIARLQNRKELALALVDWAMMESDRGLRLLELTNQLAEARKGGGGTTIIVGPLS